MKSLIIISYLVGLAISAPTSASSRLPTVQLRTTGPDNTHYSSSNQTPSNKGGHIMTIAVGVTLSSLEQDPLLLQGMEIVSVEGERTGDVFCKASLNNSSRGVVFSSKDGMVMLNQGKVAKVTRLSCGFGEQSV